MARGRSRNSYSRKIRLDKRKLELERNRAYRKPFKTKGKGWRKESYRHSLAARGISTAYKRGKHGRPPRNAGEDYYGPPKMEYPTKNQKGETIIKEQKSRKQPTSKKVNKKVDIGTKHKGGESVISYKTKKAEEKRKKQILKNLARTKKLPPTSKKGKDKPKEEEKAEIPTAADIIAGAEKVEEPEKPTTPSKSPLKQNEKAKAIRWHKNGKMTDKQLKEILDGNVKLLKQTQTVPPGKYSNSATKPKRTEVKYRTDRQLKFAADLVREGHMTEADYRAFADGNEKVMKEAKAQKKTGKPLEKPVPPPKKPEYNEVKAADVIAQAKNPEEPEKPSTPKKPSKPSDYERQLEYMMRHQEPTKITEPSVFHDKKKEEPSTWEAFVPDKERVSETPEKVETWKNVEPVQRWSSISETHKNIYDERPKSPYYDKQVARYNELMRLKELGVPTRRKQKQINREIKHTSNWLKSHRANRKTKKEKPE